MSRLVQLQRGTARRVALVREPNLHILSFPTTYDLLQHALHTNTPIAHLIDASLTPETLPYDPIYQGASDWSILPPLTHPDPAHTLVSGTGLTHLGSAQSRNAMHETPAADETDSMKMFRWGVEQGKPANDTIGIAPEWFYKGTGALLRAHNQPLDRPSYAEDGGEEAEIAGLYLIDPAGNPIRIGMAQGNEFSDHLFEKRNYLNLAGSKLRQCAVGPELLLSPTFTSIQGTAAILRNNQPLWQKEIKTGEAEMCHSLSNIEHHHFKFESHRLPGDVHIHFFGAHALSFADKILLDDGDIMQVAFQGFGRPLKNPLRRAAAPDALVTTRPLT